MKALKDLEKEIGCGNYFNFKEGINNRKCGNYSRNEEIILLCPECQARQDILKEVKEIITNEINLFTNNFINSVTGIISSSFTKNLFCKELKSKLGLSENKE